MLSQTRQPLNANPATGITANKATAVGTSGTMKYTAAVRSLKRPASDSPGSSQTSKTDPLKRPKTTTTTPTPKATVSTEVPAKSAVRQTLNPRLISRAPVPHGIRLKYLEVLQTEITRLSGNPKGEAATQKIIEKCLDLEEEVATKKRDIYRSAISNLCMRYKKATPRNIRKSYRKKWQKPLQHLLAGLDNAKLPLDTGLAKSTEVTRLRDLVANTEVLKKHSYVLTPPTEEEIEQAREGLAAASGYEHCERCNQRFQVFPGRRISDGSLTTGGTCNYHYGRKSGLRPTPGAVSEQKWTCCSRVVGFDSGCEIAPTHVFKVSDPKRLALTLQFTHTPKNPRIKHDRALALDCEMSYTSLGMELVRLTATAFPSGKIVIDALVKPYGVVLDFNTRFSGVTQEMLSSAPLWKPTAAYPDAVTTDLINPTLHTPPSQLGCFSTPEHARRALYNYIGPDTILIGHALENDLLHLRMCHSAIVDTVVLFPHQKGLPVRNKLKYVVEKVLGREIQVDGGIRGLRGMIRPWMRGVQRNWRGGRLG
ncbi:hypothetical protein BDD12DRAFT_919588, partial [Trichophaea hybrida]